MKNYKTVSFLASSTSFMLYKARTEIICKS
ncbi:hypothetical protein CAEBREN_14104 [Caenorhabditis brenneri]|uniref:Uncharacterized protein n=1 Tax=Caenorhabditis brenneri TaxID=135651 RepID=G0NKD6_CAEBE|nr:hypothetical protein CAEBREN_14104 [Caenorhabditis brenneri]